MAHKNQLEFFGVAIKEFSEKFCGSVIDIGSLDTNGGPHNLFSAKKYVGVDLGPGKNVNYISSGQQIDLPTSSFDVVMSSECFEHNSCYKETFAQMARLVDLGGIVIWSCAGLGRLEHGTSRSGRANDAAYVVSSGYEYYKNVTPKMAKSVLDHDYWFSCYNYWYNEESCDTYFVGIRRSVDAAEDVLNISRFRNLVCIYDSMYSTQFWRLRYLLEFFGCDNSFYYLRDTLFFFQERFPIRMKAKYPRVWNLLKKAKNFSKNRY